LSANIGGKDAFNTSAFFMSFAYSLHSTNGSHFPWSSFVAAVSIEIIFVGIHIPH